MAGTAPFYAGDPRFSGLCGRCQFSPRFPASRHEEGDDMANRARKLAWTTMTAVAMVMPVSTAYAEPQPRVVVWIRYADAPSPMQLAAFEIAKREAAAIYANAGISLEWSEEAPPKADAGAMYLTAQVVSDRRAHGFMRANPDLPNSVLGVAPHNTGRVYLFWDRIVRHASKKGVLTQRVLGRVLAHEIGHHLLPEKGHSSSGLIRSSLDYAFSQPPTFTHAQIEEVRTFLSAPPQGS